MIRDLRRQAPAARMIGEFAVKHGSRVLAERMGRVFASSAVVSSSAPAESAWSGDQEAAVGASTSVVSSREAEPFAHYDTYTSRQVLERMSTATAEERERVRAYEAAHRARETILSGLLASTDAPVSL